MLQLRQIEMQMTHSRVTDHKEYLMKDTTSCHESKILVL